MIPASKKFMPLALDGKLAHDGHPILARMVDNITMRQDPAGNIKPDKAKPTKKIDGVVATIMALDRAIHCGNTPMAGTVYDSRGLLIFK